MNPSVRGVPLGRRSPLKRGPFSTPKHTWLPFRRAAPSSRSGRHGCGGKWLRRVRSDHKHVNRHRPLRASQIRLEAWPTPRKRTDYQFRAGMSDVIHSSQATPLKPTGLADGPDGDTRGPLRMRRPHARRRRQARSFCRPDVTGIMGQARFFLPDARGLRASDAQSGPRTNAAPRRPAAAAVVSRIIRQGGAGRLS